MLALINYKHAAAGGRTAAELQQIRSRTKCNAAIRRNSTSFQLPTGLGPDGAFGSATRPTNASVSSCKSLVEFATQQNARSGAPNALRGPIHAGASFASRWDSFFGSGYHFLDA